MWCENRLLRPGKDEGGERLRGWGGETTKSGGQMRDFVCQYTGAKRLLNKTRESDIRVKID